MTRKTHSKKHDRDSAKRSVSDRVKQFYHDRRGQTFFDFVIGITLFLFIIVFTVFFIPDLIDPFEPSPDASTVLADRGADQLTQDVMRADGAGPYVLDQECTVAMFDGEASTACDVGSDDLHVIVGVGERTNVNATIVDSDGESVEIDGVELTEGDDAEMATSNVYSATRVVTINGERYELEYKVW